MVKMQKQCSKQWLPSTGHGDRRACARHDHRARGSQSRTCMYPSAHAVPHAARVVAQYPRPMPNHRDKHEASARAWMSLRAHGHAHARRALGRGTGNARTLPYIWSRMALLCFLIHIFLGLPS
ncbi:hypothetical protein PanWU01x14_200810 [Parasponia andersonii]|uniref:Uncharacterized protein n=1 Tax=Parasponia andersonii TaxID=3476 RepID=A0A2P5BXW8_PARAD|nr:hypothetical protein PanWU01x14_200810 [Parasponia andersonii]